MKALVSAFTLSLFTVLLFSCQREIEAPPNQDNVLEDSTYIVKTISLDTTKPIGQDTVIIVDYSYDAQRRLKKHTLREVGLVSSAFVYTDYFYNGVDTTPYKSITTNGSPTDSSICYYTYTNGFIVKDSLINYSLGGINFATIRFFSAIGSTKYLIKRYEYQPIISQTVYLDSTIYKRTLVNSNIVSSVDSVWASVGPYLNFESQNATYDTKMSPFNKLNVWYLGYHQPLFYDYYLSGNNNTISYSYITDLPFTPPVNYAISYTYNANNYPVKAILSGSPDVNKVLFFYTQL